MKLYFSPLACSLATRIALYEAGATATYVRVDGKTKKTEDGRDFSTINSLGLVPVLETEPGEVLTENAAILQFLAASYPEARLAPDDLAGRTHLQQILSFIGTELHKGLFGTLLDKTAHPEVHAHVRKKADSRLGWLDRRLAGREFVLDRFSVADGYLYTVLNWALATGYDLKNWPSLHAYHAHIRQRPSVARAFSEELQMYMQEHEQQKSPEPATAAAAP
jgi:glutathione S-transferase